MRLVKMVRHGAYSNASIEKKFIFINNIEDEKINIEVLKKKFPDLEIIYFAKKINNELKQELNGYSLDVGYLDKQIALEYELQKKGFVYYPEVYSSKLELEKEAFFSSNIDHSRPFLAVKSCLNYCRGVFHFFEKMKLKNVTYGEFSVKIGSTLLSLLPFIDKAYVTDFYLLTEVVKKRLKNKLKKVNTFVLSKENNLENVLKKLKEEGIHFDVSFFDTDHKKEAKKELKILSEISDYLIVHDVNYEQVKKDCDEVLKKFPYEEDIRKVDAGTITRFYYIKK